MHISAKEKTILDNKTQIFVSTELNAIFCVRNYTANMIEAMMDKVLSTIYQPCLDIQTKVNIY